jgi:predicted RNA-binding Zn-ribbon protein involved in translation (DUF1610 family)
MARYTWTKFKCIVCGRVERYRGKHYNISLCTNCGRNDVFPIEIHWGNEKYAGEKAGTIERIERFAIG